MTLPAPGDEWNQIIAEITLRHRRATGTEAREEFNSAVAFMLTVAQNM